MPSSSVAHFFDARFADNIDAGRAASSRRPQASPQLVTQPSRDTELLARIAAHDESAFADIFREHTPNMFRVAVALLGSADMAADVVQSVMLRLWDQRATLSIRNALGAYLRSATINSARNAIRSAARHSAAVERAAIALVPETRAVSQGQDASQNFDEDEHRLIILDDAIRQLPDRTREIFLLWWNGELSYAEIAAEMGISVKGVERARARALDALRSALLKAGYGPRNP